MLTGEKLGEALAAAIKMKGVSKADVARHFGVKPPSVQGWIKHGRISKSHIEKLLTYFSDVVGPEYWGISSGLYVAHDLGPAIKSLPRPVRIIDSEDDITSDVIEVPRYTVKASAGDGAPVMEVDVEGTPNYCRAGWAKRNGYKEIDLFSIVAIGDSMEPTIPNGSSLIVHKTKDISNGKVHVICRGDECYVKRLFKQMDGSVLIKSDNTTAYKDITATPEDKEKLYIVGVVVSVSFNI